MWKIFTTKHKIQELKEHIITLQKTIQSQQVMLNEVYKKQRHVLEAMDYLQRNVESLINRNDPVKDAYPKLLDAFVKLSANPRSVDRDTPTHMFSVFDELPINHPDSISAKEEMYLFPYTEKSDKDLRQNVQANRPEVIEQESQD